MNERQTQVLLIGLRREGWGEGERGAYIEISSSSPSFPSLPALWNGSPAPTFPPREKRAEIASTKSRPKVFLLFFRLIRIFAPLQKEKREAKSQNKKTERSEIYHIWQIGSALYLCAIGKFLALLCVLHFLGGRKKIRYLSVPCLGNLSEIVCFCLNFKTSPSARSTRSWSTVSPTGRSPPSTARSQQIQTRTSNSSKILFPALEIAFKLYYWNLHFCYKK